jgi:hypothetical protein
MVSIFTIDRDEYGAAADDNVQFLFFGLVRGRD